MAEMGSDYGCCEMFLFRNITNTEVLHAAVLEGKVQCAMIKPSLVAHPLQVAVATKKALMAAKRVGNASKTDLKNKGMITKSIFTEILYNLAPTKNIAESLKTFGLSKDDKNILVVLIKEQTQATENQLHQKDLLNIINGDLVSQLMDTEQGLPSLTNWEFISKVYKLKSVTPNTTDIIDILVSRAATKDVM